VDFPVATRCQFYHRRAVPGGYAYDCIAIDSPDMGGALVTTHPPAVGDRIGLTDRDTHGPGIYLVLERCWQYPAYGSVAWPYGKSPEAPIVQVVVEAAEGLFRDEPEEAPTPEAPS
jgi:hypothetical protein